MVYRPIRKSAANAAKRVPASRGRQPNRARRDAILRATSHLFERNGYYGTTMRAIAHEAGITPSLLQKYFPTKESLLQVFVETAMDHLDRFMIKLRHRIQTLKDPFELVRRVGEDYIEFVDEMRGFYLTWIMCPELTEPYRDALPAFISIGHAALADALAKRLSIPYDSALLRSRMLFASLFSYVIYYRRLGFPGYRLESPNKRLDRLAHVITSRRLDIASQVHLGHG